VSQPRREGPYSLFHIGPHRAAQTGKGIAMTDPAERRPNHLQDEGERRPHRSEDGPDVEGHLMPDADRRPHHRGEDEVTEGEEKRPPC
jgi:hypothetical protein